MDKEKLVEHEAICEERFPKKASQYIEELSEDDEPEDLSFKRYGCTSSKMLNMSLHE